MSVSCDVQSQPEVTISRPEVTISRPEVHVSQPEVTLSRPEFVPGKAENGEETVLVALRPFPHQAGGHTAVLELNRSTICKPFGEREAWFYENEPETLLEFTPKYLGQTEVTCDMCNERLQLTAAIPRRLAAERGLVAFDPRATGAATGPSNSSPVSNILTRRKSRKRCLNSEDTRQSASKSGDVTSCLEGWSIKCIERQIDRYGFWANNQPQRFILLENLVHTYRKPCLMDVKMGRRQFGDDSSAEKRRLLVERCSQSTSATLGFRISGTQVFQSSTNQYCVRDKYVGRDLDNRGAINEIRHYFFNGHVVRHDVIAHVIQKLERLKAALIDCDTLNFYSCSLLLIYEGSEDSLDCQGDGFGESTSGEEFKCGIETGESERFEDSRNKVDVRLIDFAHVSQKEPHQSGGDAVDKCLPRQLRSNAVQTGAVQTGDKTAPESSDDKLDDTVIYGIEQLLQVLRTESFT